MSKYPVKAKVVAQLIAHLEKERAFYERIAAQARLDAIDGEMKQEGKYDTRAIEAAYLAGAQKRRLDEIIVELHELRALPTHQDLDASVITVGSLVALEDSKGKHRWYYLSPSSGGVDVEDSETVKAISLHSPLARSLVGLAQGEEITSSQAPEALRGAVVDTIL